MNDETTNRPPMVATDAQVRLDEIEARAKAAAAVPRCEHCGDELAGGRLCRGCGLDAVCRSGGDDVPLRERSLYARYVADVPWLVAQVRERDDEIARLRSEVTKEAVGAGGWRCAPWGWTRSYGAGRAGLVMGGGGWRIALYDNGTHVLSSTMHPSMSDEATRLRCDEHARREGWRVDEAADGR